MISCPNCAHNNPDGAVNCEACFTLLPVVRYIPCPNCEATVLSDAKFCGHCGFNLSAAHPSTGEGELSAESMNLNYAPTYPEVAALFEGQVSAVEPNLPSSLPPDALENQAASSSNATVPITSPTNVVSANPASSMNLKTQLQQFSASLLHVQTNLTLELPAHLPVIHIGKPNTVIPPDIDVSGFPDSDIVSRIHGDIRAEGGTFYFEDTGSSNGTYINNLPLPTGNRHKLRAGDRISLGKGDKVTFIFQLNS